MYVCNITYYYKTKFDSETTYRYKTKFESETTKNATIMPQLTFNFYFLSAIK